MQSLYPALAALAAYLVGSLSFAVIVSRAMGLPDPRSYGSGNPGATNVLRSGSKAAAIATLLLDALKGWLPVVLVQWHGPAHGLETGSVALVAMAAFLGHLWPLGFGFKGGKGVATAAGVIFALNPWLGLATLATWGIVAFFFRYASLASISAALFAPVYYLFGDTVAWSADTMTFAAMATIGGLVILRHRENIARLLAGTESRLGKKSPPPDADGG